MRDRDGMRLQSDTPPKSGNRKPCPGFHDCSNPEVWVEAVGTPCGPAGPAVPHLRAAGEHCPLRIVWTVLHSPYVTVSPELLHHRVIRSELRLQNQFLD